MINSSEKIIAQIKRLSLYITENTYDVGIEKGYKLLVRLHDFGMEKENVYQALFEYYNALEDSLSRDYIADILDYVVGWCSLEKCIWNAD